MLSRCSRSCQDATPGRQADSGIDTATSAKAAPDKLKGGPYDAVVSDYPLPGMEGITFLTLLRNEYPILHRPREGRGGDRGI